MPTSETDAELVARVRADTAETRVHLNHAGASITPTPVLDHLRAHLDLEAEIGGYEAAAAMADELDAVPSALAALLGPGVDADEVVVRESASRGWESVLWALAETFDWGPADQVLVDQFTYATVHGGLMRLRMARGVDVRVAPARDDGTLDADGLAAAMDERTRLVAVTHMPTHIGAVTDVGAVGAVLADHPAVFALDVAQTVGLLPLDLGAIGCQVAFAPGRKFLRAPRGSGLLYVRADLAEQLVPLTPAFGAVDAVGSEPFDQPPAARRFDEFEGSVAVRLALGAAARYATDLGLDRIAGLVRTRSAAVTELLGQVPGVRVLSPADAVGIVSFVHERLTPDEVRLVIADEGVNVWVNPAAGAPVDGARRPVLPSVRVSPHYVTDDGDLERLALALDRLA